MGSPASEQLKAFLIGEGIAYSASLVMQEAAFRACGLDWVYELRDIPASGLPAVIAELREPETVGANVGIPHKVAIRTLLDGLEGDAELAGAVNTVCKVEGRLIGLNTDVIGIRAALGAVGLEPAGARAVVLGAGGSARAAALALKGARLTFVARHPERAAGLPGEVRDWSDPAWPRLVRRADLLLNATPLGRREEMPLRPGFLPSRGAVIDLVYLRGGTPLVRKARSLGIRCADGWGVLLAPGARSFEIWTGKAAPLEAMRQTLPE